MHEIIKCCHIYYIYIYIIHSFLKSCYFYFFFFFFFFFFL
ncbi:hypothetical protein PFFCH_03816 [Plasmodium falciparum FCH/4]|uniref:Uncharacterized protein n=1 Tax=Plasmodium falciparum FCH/4 TaxID=1036724 RepID=A0A024VJI7_PLAFA|nr:hypothetical protein PFFCH_03816 [Plasmodium falciparum FCH/4]